MPSYDLMAAPSLNGNDPVKTFASVRHIVRGLTAAWNQRAIPRNRKPDHVVRPVQYPP